VLPHSPRRWVKNSLVGLSDKGLNSVILRAVELPDFKNRKGECTSGCSLRGRTKHNAAPLWVENRTLMGEFLINIRLFR